MVTIYAHINRSMIMENKPYTLQDAKNEVARKRNYESWYYVDFNCENEESMRDETAKLYAAKVTEELRKENEYLRKIIAEKHRLHTSVAKIQQ